MNISVLLIALFYLNRVCIFIAHTHQNTFIIIRLDRFSCFVYFFQWIITFLFQSWAVTTFHFLFLSYRKSHKNILSSFHTLFMHRRDANIFPGDLPFLFLLFLFSFKDSFYSFLHVQTHNKGLRSYTFCLPHFLLLRCQHNMWCWILYEISPFFLLIQCIEAIFLSIEKCETIK